MAVREYIDGKENAKSNESDWMIVRRLLVLILCACVAFGLWNFIAGKWLHLDLLTGIGTLLVLTLLAYRKKRQNAPPSRIE